MSLFTRRKPRRRERILGRVLYLILSAVLMLSLAMGIRVLTEPDRSTSVTEPAPVACAEPV